MEAGEKKGWKRERTTLALRRESSLGFLVLSKIRSIDAELKKFKRLWKISVKNTCAKKLFIIIWISQQWDRQRNFQLCFIRKSINESMSRHFCCCCSHLDPFPSAVQLAHAPRLSFFLPYPRSKKWKLLPTPRSSQTESKKINDVVVAFPFCLAPQFEWRIVTTKSRPNFLIQASSYADLELNYPALSRP